MPTTAQILAALTETANAWRPVAIFWHVYLAALAITFFAGARLSKRTIGVLLGLPLISVSACAWLARNPFNGAVFAVVALLTIVMSAALPSGRAQRAPLRWMIPGAGLFVFGFIYPHFLNASSFLAYLYSGPLGLIPCPTLSAVIGAVLVLNGLGSRALSLTLGIAGVFYGFTGAARLGVTIDWLLLAGALILVVFAVAHRFPGRTSAP